MLQCINKIIEITSGFLSVVPIAGDFSQITFFERNFGSSIVKIILVLANTNYSGIATLCSVDVGTE